MLPPYLTDEELFALYLCVFNSYDSSCDENEDGDDDAHTDDDDALSAVGALLLLTEVVDGCASFRLVGLGHGFRLSRRSGRDVRGWSLRT